MQDAQVNRRSRLAIDELLNVIEAEIARRHFADILDEIAGPYAELIGRRSLEHRDDVGVAADLRQDHAGLSAARLRVILLDLFGRQVGAVRVKPFGQSAQAADANFFEVGLLDIITNNVAEHFIEDRNLAVLAAARNDLARLRHEAADNGIEGNQG